MVEKIENNELNEILNHIKEKHNFLLTGGAGCGKTYTLVEVLKNISKMYPTASIACITYTNAAAIEIMNRANIDNLAISTIHDFLWNEIRQFPIDLKKTLIEIINDEENDSIKNPNKDETFDLSKDVDITYKEYISLSRGVISHDEVLTLAEVMFKKYSKLNDIVKDKYQFIFVDEYQDTSPKVIKILLEYLQKSNHSNIIGFFGDSMQSIYDGSIGTIQEYVDKKIVYEVRKKENRRNPKKVIEIANKLRLDSLQQIPSKDVNAPNMENGKVKDGNIKFIYSIRHDLQEVKKLDFFNNWNFHNPKETKELRLTNNLIADEGHFKELMNIYGSDPIHKLKKIIKDKVKDDKTFDENISFDNAIRMYDGLITRGKNKGKTGLEAFLEVEGQQEIYDYVKEWPYYKVKAIYMDKETLLDNGVIIDNVVAREPKRDQLLKHLFKIQDIIYLYENKKYNELIKNIQIRHNEDKIWYVNILEELSNMKDSTIGEVIEYADKKGLCMEDDKLHIFKENNKYLYWRVSKVQFSEFQNLYNYLNEFLPYSTQHSVKGLEYDNVLVVLENGKWSKYNFEYLFDDNIEKGLTTSKKKSYPTILERTKKLFYVCCTRAKENLVVFYSIPSTGVIEGAKAMFGQENCIDADGILDDKTI